jgi:hypothetical protein
LFTVANCLQENLIKGGILYPNYKTGNLRKTKSIKSADRDIKINTMIWIFMENYRLNKKF